MSDFSTERIYHATKKSQAKNVNRSAPTLCEPQKTCHAEKIPEVAENAGVTEQKIEQKPPEMAKTDRSNYSYKC